MANNGEGEVPTTAKSRRKWEESLPSSFCAGTDGVVVYSTTTTTDDDDDDDVRGASGDHDATGAANNLGNEPSQVGNIISNCIRLPSNKRQRTTDDENAEQKEEQQQEQQQKQQQQCKCCENCLTNKPRTEYKEIEWNKVYGGWTCLDCSNNEREQQRENESLAIRSLKRKQYEQKLAEQLAKKQGIFMEQRPCFQCSKTKSRTSYSGKQWKKLYRQCLECVQEFGFQKVELRDLLPPSTNKKKKKKKKEQSYNDGSKYCCGCKETKSISHYRPQQWQEPYERLCNPCWEEEEQAKQQHLQLIKAAEEDEEAADNADANNKVNANKTKTTKRCFACHEFLPPKSFSTRQLSKQFGMCTSCVEIMTNDRKEDKRKATESNTRPCSLCGIQKKISEYGKGQWNRSDPRCRSCAVALVERMDEHRQLEKDYNNNDNDNGNQSGNEEDEGVSEKERRRCFQCEQFLDIKKYSHRQRTKTYPTCKDCSVEKIARSKRKVGGSADLHNEDDDNTM